MLYFLDNFQISDDCLLVVDAEEDVVDEEKEVDVAPLEKEGIGRDGVDGAGGESAAVSAFPSSSSPPDTLLLLLLLLETIFFSLDQMLFVSADDEDNAAEVVEAAVLSEERVEGRSERKSSSG